MEEKWTEQDQEVIKIMDRAISELVYEKIQMVKAYNYYHCKRDPDQFRHLEENYGIGSPTSVKFVPLVRKHIDVLIGEYLSTPLLPRVSCNDSKTLKNIEKDKNSGINNKIISELKDKLKEAVFSNTMSYNTTNHERHLNDLHESFDLNYLSDYEIAGQNIVDWSMQNRLIDFSSKRALILLNLLITGTSFYRVYPTPSKSGVRLKVLNPINTFIDRNPESQYLKDSLRAVHREFLTKDQILTEYGDYIKEEDLEQLESAQQYNESGSYMLMNTQDGGTGNFVSDGIVGGFEITTLLPYNKNASKFYRTFPVYYVEWIKSEKVNGKFVSNRYEGVRIGSNIYIPMGKAETIRSIDDDKHACLSINGMFYSDYNGDPFSLVLKTADLQD